MNALDWPSLLKARQRPLLAATLLEHVKSQRWFRGKARGPRSATIADVIALGPVDAMAVVRIAYETGDADLIAIPLAYVDRAPAMTAALPPGSAIAPTDDVSPAIIASLGGDGIDGALVDGLTITGHAAELLLGIVRDAQVRPGDSTPNGGIRGQPFRPFTELLGADIPVARFRVGEQTNSTAVFGDRALLKIYRHLLPGPGPELEMGRFLGIHGPPLCVPRVLGTLTYQDHDGTTFDLGIAHEFIANQGDALSLALSELRSYFARVLGQPAAAAPRAVLGIQPLLSRSLDRGGRAPTQGPDVGRFVRLAATLGRRIATLHVALASAGPDQPDFSIELMDVAERTQQTIRVETMLAACMDALSAALPHLSARSRQLADTLVVPHARAIVSGKLVPFKRRDLRIAKMRTHGDLHLGQVLTTGDDFVVVDFEGEPARSLAERRAKTSPLRDVMGIVRSFDYAPEILLRDPTFGIGDPTQRHQLEPWAALWKAEVTTSFLRGYFGAVEDAAFLPDKVDDLVVAMTFYELEKVIYEIAYESNYRPAWLEIPLRGLAAIVNRDIHA